MSSTIFVTALTILFHEHFIKPCLVDWLSRQLPLPLQDLYDVVAQHAGGQEAHDDVELSSHAEVPVGGIVDDEPKRLPQAIVTKSCL